MAHLGSVKSYQLVFLTTAFFQGKDTCRFDGGGPLVCNDLLTGVVGTFGASCAAKDTPRQSGYIKWQKFFFFSHTITSVPQKKIPSAVVYYYCT